MRSIAVSAFLFATSAAADESAETVARARAEFQQRLETASEAGVVTIRGAAQQTPGGPASTPAATPPALRSFERAECLTTDALALADATLRDDPQGGLERLRRALLEDSAAFREGRELELARGYLAVGFAEEARAIAMARHGVEAAGIAGLGFLAEGDPQSALTAVAGLRGCGALYGFVHDAASFLRGETKRLTDNAAATLEALPAALRAPISAALALAAIEHDIDAPGLTDAALRQEDVSGPSDAHALLRALTNEDPVATRRLAILAAEPSPVRRIAMGELSKRIDAATPSEIVAGFELDLEDEASASNQSHHAWGLGLQLAERRLAAGNIDGGVKALGAAFRNPSTRSAAIARFRALETSLATSTHADQGVQRLAAIFAEPELSAAVLDENALAISAKLAAELGAADALIRLKSVAPVSGAIGELALAEALMRSGREAEAGKIVRDNASDPRFSALAVQVAFVTADKDAELAAARRLGPEETSAALWRQGDFAALLALDSDDRLNSQTATRIALAALALKQAVPPRALRHAADPERLQSLFADGSRLDLADLDALRRLSKATADTISYLNARVGHE